jgi:hypothetical protein
MAKMATSILRSPGWTRRPRLRVGLLLALFSSTLGVPDLAVGFPRLRAPQSLGHVRRNSLTGGEVFSTLLGVI